VSAGQALGLKFRLLGWHFRIWKYGFEYGNKFGGRVRFFPWHPKGCWYK
jgi:hypothetical protein